MPRLLYLILKVLPCPQKAYKIDTIITAYLLREYKIPWQVMMNTIVSPAAMLVVRPILDGEILRLQSTPWMVSGKTKSQNISVTI